MACGPRESVSSVLLGTTGAWPPHGESGFAWSEPPFLQNLNTEAQEGQGHKRAWGWSHPLGKTHPNAVNHPRACQCQISSLPRGQAPWYVSPSRKMTHTGSLSTLFLAVVLARGRASGTRKAARTPSYWMNECPGATFSRLRPPRSCL